MLHKGRRMKGFERMGDNSTRIGKEQLEKVNGEGEKKRLEGKARHEV